MPLAVFAVADTGSPLAADRLTVNTALTVPLWPSVTVALPIPIVGAASLSTIVPRPLPSRIVALVGLVSVTVNVSSPSSRLSPSTDTVTCCVVAPGVNVSVPGATAVKSVPATAVTPATL